MENKTYKVLIDGDYSRTIEADTVTETDEIIYFRKGKEIVGIFHLLNIIGVIDITEPNEEEKDRND